MLEFRSSANPIFLFIADRKAASHETRATIDHEKGYYLALLSVYHEAKRLKIKSAAIQRPPPQEQTHPSCPCGKTGFPETQPHYTHQHIELPKSGRLPNSSGLSHMAEVRPTPGR